MKKALLSIFIFLIGQSLVAQKHIHWGSTGDPLNGLVITWKSENTSDQIKWGYTASYEQGTYYGIRRNNYSRYLYDYAFPRVDESSTIHYSIYSNGIWTSDKTFQTSVSLTSTQFSFIAGGDSRTYMDDWNTSANKLATEAVDFNLFMGDHVNSGSSTKDWDDWFEYGENFLEKHLIYHTGGNHEYGPIYLNQFVMPENEKWYSFEFGNALFICLFTEEDLFTQHTWLVNELSTTTKTWKIVFFHKPFFTTGSHSGDMNLYRSTWWKAFDDYGVDVILNGHTHYYLRTKPINLNISTTSAVDRYGSNSGEGRLQIVAGSYGAPVKPTGNDWFIEENKSTMNYAKFSINDSILQMDAYNMSGILIDHVSIDKKLGSADYHPIDPKPDPTEFLLSQNFPNPFKSSTTIDYSLSKSGYVIIEIFNLMGKRIETLVDEYQFIGDHQILWRPKELNRGIYYYRLQTANSSSNSSPSFSETKMLMYQK